MAASLAAAIVLMVILYFVYVKPMRKAENSTGYSIRDLIGQIGEVSVPIPADGYGEVLVTAGFGRVNQIATSFDGKAIPDGTRVIVVDAADGVLRVSPFDP